MASGADAVARFSFDIDGNAASAAADQSRALANLQEKIQGDTVALRGMQKALRDLQGGSAVNIAVARDLRDRIAAQKATIASTTQSYVQMGGTFKDLGKKGVEAGKGFGSLAEAARAAPGPLSGLSSKLGAINAVLAGGALSAGLLLVAAAIVAVTAAAIVGFAALAKYGVGVADARRSELLHLDALTKLRFGWYGLAGAMGPAADKASFLQSTIDSVSQSTALGRDQVAAYAEQLYKTGLRSGNLQAALEGVTTVAATQGETAAGSFMAMAQGAAFAGTSVRKLADDVKARLGGIAAAQMLSLDVQSKKLHESFGMIFSGLKIDSLLSGLNKITSMFSQNEATGRALKALVDGLFGPLIDQVSGPASMLMKRFFQGMTIAALLLGITILKLRNWFRSTFADSTTLRGLDLMRLSVAAGMGVVFAFAAAIVLTGIVLANLAALILAPIAGIILLGVAIYQGIKAIGRFISEAARVGADLVEGLISGIKSGASGVIKALENLGGDAMAAFKKKLGIASPSRIAMRAAIEVPRGMALGIRAGQPEVERATRALVSIPTGMGDKAQDGAVPTAGASARSPSHSLSIGEIHVHAPTGQGEDIADTIVRKIHEAFAGMAISLGAPVP